MIALQQQTFAAVNLDGYSHISPCKWMTLTVLPQRYLATSPDTSKYPTFEYDIATGEKTCTASGMQRN